MEEVSFVAKNDGAFVSTVGGAFVARESETSVRETCGTSAARDGVAVFLESEASVVRVDGASVTS
jgi:hypothetical protein